MSGFKLIAIRPLKGCDKKFLKVLKAGEVYRFYNNYQFNVINNEVKSIDFTPTVPEGLYDVGELKVNISAVVGKNGSGKSSLLELLYLSLYKIGIDCEILNGLDYYINESTKPLSKGEIQDAKIKIYDSELSNLAYVDENKNRRDELEILLKYYRDQKEKFIKTFEARKSNSSRYALEIEAIEQGLNVELYYSYNSIIYRLEIVNENSFHTPLYNENNKTNPKDIPLNITRKFKINKIKRRPLSKENIPLLSELFYSIALNYATHGLNSNHLGLWIRKLFHKNDGYQTPIVLNPMRTKGNYDINDENERAIYRLLHNILLQKNENPGESVFITDNQFVSKVRIRFNKQYKISDRVKNFEESGIKSDGQVMAIISGLQSAFYPQDTYSQALFYEAKFPFSDSILGYIYNKFFKIIDTYEGYRGLYKPSPDYYKLSDELISKLEKDQSHIVFKLRQAFNFILNVNKINSGAFNWMELERKFESEAFVDFPLDELFDWINCKQNEELINYLPPAIFSFDLTLSSEDKIDEKAPTFNALSSGEQQMIHSIQSVLYHLLNLNSVHYGGDKRTAFKSINIVFDEIELYFHPDYQRKFIDLLLKSIDRLKLGKKYRGIKALNILFSTHSPFILSDIPSANILRLKKGIVQHHKDHGETFGANVHELLIDSFFIQSTIGEYSKKEIIKCLKKLTPKSNKKNKLTKKEQVYFKNLIEQIGEPLIKVRLKDLYNKYIGKPTYEELEKELIKIRKSEYETNKNK